MRFVRENSLSLFVLVQKGSPESKKPGEAGRGAVADFLNAALSSSKRTRPGSDPN
jgi:hypothetical protein